MYINSFYLMPYNFQKVELCYKAVIKVAIKHLFSLHLHRLEVEKLILIKNCNHEATVMTPITPELISAEAWTQRVSPHPPFCPPFGQILTFPSASSVMLYLYTRCLQTFFCPSQILHHYPIPSPST